MGRKGVRINYLEGKKIGKWTVLRFAPEKTCKSGRGAYYLCRCECGKEKLVNGFSLSGNRSFSCGCMANRKPYGQANFTVYYHQYKSQARDRKHAFKLTKDEFRDIVTKNCFYCGQKPSKEIKDRPTGVFKASGIDRIDSYKGYAVGNCVPCCRHCNYAKNRFTQKEFKEHIIKIYKHWGSNGNKKY